MLADRRAPPRTEKEKKKKEGLIADICGTQKKRSKGATYLELLLLSVVFNKNLLQLVVDAFHAAGYPGNGGLWHSDVGQRHLG